MDLKSRNREMRDFFNEKADGYDSVHLKMMPNKEAITEALPEGTARVLDLGAGTGLELIPLFERFPDAKVTCVDISENQLEELKKRPFADHLEIVCGDFFAIDFGTACYDAVISSAALHHFDEQEKAELYARLFSCLKPGGMFVNSDRWSATQEEQDYAFERLIAGDHGYRHWDTPLTISNEQKLLERAGFVNFRAIDLADERYKVMVAEKA